MARKRDGSERRKKPRIALARGLLARFGTLGVILVDASETGARIEHYDRHNVGKKGRFRFDWDEQIVETEAVVVWCRVHRFAPGDEGATVYQSGLVFTDYLSAGAPAIQKIVTTFIARSLAEQVANARGIGPVTQKTMPVFRSGAVAGSADRGYVRCVLIDNRRWNKKWSRTNEQPQHGFTVPASEPE